MAGLAIQAGCLSLASRQVSARRLVDTTYECMWKGIRAVKPGATLGDIGHAIQTHAEAAGFFGSCAITAAMALARLCTKTRRFFTTANPVRVRHWLKAWFSQLSQCSMQASTTPHYLVIEWTVVTKDRGISSAQWEHQLIVTDDGYEVLSTSPGMPEPPTE
ncbi:type I methionyl aminopeptidase [Oligella ureolytica]